MNGVQKFEAKIYELVKAEAKRRHKNMDDVMGDTAWAVNLAEWNNKRK